MSDRVVELVGSLTEEAWQHLVEACSAVNRFNELTAIIDSLGYHQTPTIEGFAVQCRDNLGFGMMALVGEPPRLIVKPGERYDPRDGMLTRPEDCFLTLANQNPSPLDPYLDKNVKIVTEPRRPRRDAVDAMRRSLGLECGWRCFYCGNPGNESVGPDNRTWHVDHVYPQSKSGDNKEDNYVLSCATCNISKGKQSAIEFVNKREARNAS